MAKRHDSALRQHRRSLRSRERNQRNTARLRSTLRKLRSLLADKKVDDLKATFHPTISLIDHSVSKKVLHRNAAARLKSRLTRQFNAATSS